MEWMQVLLDLVVRNLLLRRFVEMIVVPSAWYACVAARRLVISTFAVHMRLRSLLGFVAWRTAIKIWNHVLLFV